VAGLWREKGVLHQTHDAPSRAIIASRRFTCDG